MPDPMLEAVHNAITASMDAEDAATEVQQFVQSLGGQGFVIVHRGPTTDLLRQLADETAPEQFDERV